MNKIEKKKKRLLEKIAFLENELNTSLYKKKSNTSEIDVAGHFRKIEEMKKELAGLK